MLNNPLFGIGFAFLLCSGLHADEQSDKIRKEAIAAFKKYRKLIIAGKIAKIDDRLLYDGEIGVEAYGKNWTQHRTNNTPLLIKILKGLKSRNNPKRILVTKRRTYSGGKKLEYWTVICELAESRGLTVLLPETAIEGPTVARNGELLLFMRKFKGKWYWNPFGWQRPASPRLPFETEIHRQ